MTRLNTSILTKLRRKKRESPVDSAVAVLNGLTLEDLLSLYIEAKTGRYAIGNALPASYFLRVDEIGKMIDAVCEEQEEKDKPGSIFRL